VGGRRIGRSHCDQDMCLGADGCNIGRGPEWARVRAKAGTRGYGARV
jgi:hypothetical protein